MSVEVLERAPVERRSIALRERLRCPSCGREDRALVWTGRFADEPVRGWIERHGYAGDPLGELGDERFELVRCDSCGLLFHARVLDEAGLARLYGTWIDAEQIERFEQRHASGRPDAMLFEQGRQTVKHLFRLHHLAKRTWPFRLLDFGCGDGRLVRIAQAFGFEAWGIDASATREARAEHAGLRVHASLETLAAIGPPPFDAVTLTQVLEHLVAPRETLQALGRLMRPGGVLLVEVPDARGIDGPPRGFEQMRIVHPLEHVNAFTPSTLEGICRRAGFRPVRRTPVHATTSFVDVLATELTRVIRVPSTSQYFLKV